MSTSASKRLGMDRESLISEYLHCQFLPEGWGHHHQFDPEVNALIMMTFKLLEITILLDRLCPGVTPSGDIGRSA